MYVPGEPRGAGGGGRSLFVPENVTHLTFYDGKRIVAADDARQLARSSLRGGVTSVGIEQVTREGARAQHGLPRDILTS